MKSEHFGKHLEAEPRGLDDGLKMRERRVNVNTKVWGLNNWTADSVGLCRASSMGGAGASRETSGTGVRRAAIGTDF